MAVVAEVTVLPLEESLFTLQKLYLSCSVRESIPVQQLKNYAFVKISPDSECVCQLFWKSDLHPSYCQVDMSVSTFIRTESNFDEIPRKPLVKSYSSLVYENIRIVSSVAFIKTMNVSVVVEEVNTVRKWRKKIEALSQIVTNILKRFIVVNSCVVKLKSLPVNIRMGIDSIVIHHLTLHGGYTSATVGQISFTTKLTVRKLFSREKFIQISNSPILGDVGGLNAPYNELRKIITRQRRDENLNGLKFCHQVLLVGPSGCGKTSLVQKVTADCDAVLLSVLGPEVYSPKPGDTEETLRHLFRKASELASEGVCVLLLDEVDSLCPKRSHKDSNSHIARAVVQLLELLQQADEVQGLVVVATTSRPYALDPAVRRPGRLEKEIYIGVPNESQRREILNIMVKPPFVGNSSSVVDELCREVASLTPGYVGADLCLLCQHVAQRRYLKDVDASNPSNLLEDFKKAVAVIRPSALRGSVGIITVEPQSMLDIGGLTGVKKTLETAVTWPVLYPRAFARLGLPQPRGVLLYGPPGCAKTTLARALATCMKTTFLSISAAELYSPFFGDAERTVLELFHRARLGAPSILFIDEIDAMVGNRSDKERGVQERILSAFLTEMDGIGVRLEKASPVQPEDETQGLSQCNNRGVIVIAATNRPDMLDDALLRPGRFDKLLYVPPPDDDGRLDILKKLLCRTPLGPCVNVEMLAKSTSFYSGADLMNLCKEAALCALTEEGMDARYVLQRHFLRALDGFRPSLNKELLSWYEDYNNSSRKLQ